MQLIRDRIDEIRENGYSLDFGTVFEKAFQNYKKIAVYAALMLLVFSILFGIVAIGIAISIFGEDVVTEALKPENLSSEKFAEDFLLIVILFTCLISPFQAGFLKMADCGEKNEEFHVSTIFKYYRLPYFINIFVSTFIISLINSGLSVLFNFAGINSFGGIISIVTSLLTYLTIPLIIFGNLNAFESIKSSVIIVLKQPLLILGFLLVAIFASLAGLIGLIIGIFFTIPFIYSMNYSVYCSIIGIDSPKEASRNDQE